jgi:hypothetical protein
MFTATEIEAIGRGELIREESRVSVYGRACAVGRTSDGDWYYRTIGEWACRFLWNRHATIDDIRKHCERSAA